MENPYFAACSVNSQWCSFSCVILPFRKGCYGAVKHNSTIDTCSCVVLYLFKFQDQSFVYEGGH